MPDHAAIILGASGSVGGALLAEVVRSARFSPVIAVARRPLPPEVGTEVQQLIVPNMEPDDLRDAVVGTLNQVTTPAVGFSVLGVGANTAKLSLEQHRAVDVDLNAAFARGLRESHRVRHLVFMSSMGADIRARTTGSGAAGMSRYRRVKGEAEAAVLSQGPVVVSIFRPSTIIGSQHTPRLVMAVASLLSPVTPARLRPIRTTEIARAMVVCALQNPAASAVYSYPEMKALAASALASRHGGSAGQPAREPVGGRTL
ncbi:MAG: NAD(P)H-binding protein [Vicinamibacterales bacterium]